MESGQGMGLAWAMLKPFKKLFKALEYLPPHLQFFVYGIYPSWIHRVLNDPKKTPHGLWTSPYCGVYEFGVYRKNHFQSFDDGWWNNMIRLVYG